MTDNIAEAARRSVAGNPKLDAVRIEHYLLRTRKDDWTLGISQIDFDYSNAAKTALRNLYGLLAQQLPADTNPVDHNFRAHPEHSSFGFTVLACSLISFR